jgi:hypothetical protein
MNKNMPAGYSFDFTTHIVHFYATGHPSIVGGIFYSCERKRIFLMFFFSIC